MEFIQFRGASTSVLDDDQNMREGKGAKGELRVKRVVNS